MTASMLEPGIPDSVLPDENDDTTPTPHQQSTTPNISPTKPTARKGKGKARAVEDSENDSNNGEEYPGMSDHFDRFDNLIGSGEQFSSREPTPEEGTHHHKRSTIETLKAQVVEHTKTISQLNQNLNETNSRVGGLEKELKAVCSIVDKLVGKCRDEAADDKATGGRIAVRTASRIPLDPFDPSFCVGFY